MKKKAYVALLLIFILCITAGCGNRFSYKPLEKEGYQLEYVEIKLPGVTKEFKFIYMSDLHIIADLDEVDKQYLETVTERKNGQSRLSGELWQTLPDLLNKCHPDRVLMGGDLIDFCSEANVNALKEGLSKLTVPYTYVRADHDFAPFYLADWNDAAAKVRQDSIGENSAVSYVNLEEFTILAINNSTNPITSEGLAVIKEAFALGKPIILLTHVPIDSMVDNSLRELSLLAKGNRVLLWNLTGSYYTPNPETAEFLSMVYAEDSLVKEILCGHLHVAWDGFVTENTHEHVFAPAFDKYLGVIKVTGQ